MASHTPTTPGIARAVTAQTRREAIAMAGATGLAGIAAVAFGAQDAPQTVEIGTNAADATLLALCAAFDAAQETQIASDAAPGLDWNQVEAIGARWHDALRDIIAAPAPRTVEGRTALARVARTAFIAEIEPSDGQPLDDHASPSELLVLKALNLLGEVWS